LTPNKKIVIIYEEYLQAYVLREQMKLQELGFTVELLLLEDAPATLGIRAIPCFALEKYGQLGSFLYGKFNDDTVVRWAQGFDWSEE
jgi:hypothetical protein